jgi:uncharacterized protein (DUF2141 family)
MKSLFKILAIGLTFVNIPVMAQVSPMLADKNTNNETASLTIDLEGIAEPIGNILVSICKQEQFMKTKCEYVGRFAVSDLEDKPVFFPKIAVGTYAVQLFQDKNEDNKLASNFIGIPTEPWGMSNDAKGKFGPPSFEDAKIIISTNSQITITLN